MSRATEFPDDEAPLAEGQGSTPEGGEEGPGRLAIKVPKVPLLGRVGEFYQAVKLEMIKTTWPTRTEVWSTTVVVLIAVVFFGFYLFGVDWVVTKGFEYLERTLR